MLQCLELSTPYNFITIKLTIQFMDHVDARHIVQFWVNTSKFTLESNIINNRSKSLAILGKTIYFLLSFHDLAVEVVGPSRLHEVNLVLHTRHFNLDLSHLWFKFYRFSHAFLNFVNFQLLTILKIAQILNLIHYFREENVWFVVDALTYSCKEHLRDVRHKTLKLLLKFILFYFKNFHMILN